MKKKGKIERKYSEARNWLHSTLMLLPPGAALPGLRQMSRQCGAGRCILEKLLAEAEQNNYLERRARSGFYRTSYSDDSPVDLIIAVDNSNGQLEPVGSRCQASYINRTVIALLDMAAEENLRVHFTNDLEAVPASKPLFLVGAGQTETIRRLEERSPRVVTVSGARSGKLQVLPPKGLTVRWALEYLCRLGHRRIGFFYSVSGNNIENSPHLFEYYKVMAENGFKVYDHFLLPYVRNEDVRGLLKESLNKSPRPDSLLVPACWLPSVYEVLAEYKLIVPWYISVLSIGVSDDEFVGNPSQSAVFDSPEKLAEEAWKLMFSNKTSELVQLAPEIIEGSSCMLRS